MDMITAHHAKLFAWQLTHRRRGGDVDRISQSLFDASVDLNPHQIDAALFALQNPLSKGVLLADEVVSVKPSRQPWCFASTGRNGDAGYW